MHEADLGLPALAALAAIGFACGLAMRLVMHATSDQVSIARTRKRMVAHLLEMRLFGDEPGLVLRAQRDVAVQSFRLIKLLLVPVAIVTVPMLLLFSQLDNIFAKSPLAPGQPAVITAHWTGGATLPTLEQTEDIAVETAPVWIAAQRQASWRIRPRRAGTGALRLVLSGRVWTKPIIAGQGLTYVSERTKMPSPNGGLEWIEVRYPGANVLGLHWLIWFFLFSGLGFVARFRG